MPKPATYPTLFDEVLQISITKLKEWGYLEPGQIKAGTITWSRNGNRTGSISIKVNTRSEQPYVELEYTFNEQARNYEVMLVSVPSNLGMGRVWYFLCPHTSKRCRKLYLIGGYFLHRKAFNGCMYDCQTQSKRYRMIDKTYGAYFKIEQLYEQLYKRYFKTHYAGKPTKRYLRLKEQIQQAESIPYHEIERLMLS